jgi:ferredoxin
MVQLTMAAKVENDKCNGCGPCVDSCPVEAIKIEDNIAVVDADTCIDCGACVDACPNSALAMD